LLLIPVLHGKRVVRSAGSPRHHHEHLGADNSNIIIIIIATSNPSPLLQQLITPRLFCH